MRGRRVGRLSLRDQRIEVNRALNHLSIMSGRPTPDGLLNKIPPKRVRAAPGSNPHRPLEKDVLADVLSALRADPRVAMVERQQSGVFKEGERWIRVGTPGALDVKGMLHGGAMFEIECKRIGEKPDERQQRRIDAIMANDGIAGCAHSAAEALALLP